MSSESWQSQDSMPWTYFLMPPPSFRMTRLSLSTVRFRRTPQAEKQISWRLASSRAIMNLWTGRAENECRPVKLRDPSCISFLKWQRGAACKTGNPARGLGPLFLSGLHPLLRSAFPNIHHFRTCSPPPRPPVPWYCCIWRRHQLPLPGSGRAPAHGEEGTTAFQSHRCHSFHL